MLLQQAVYDQADIDVTWKQIEKIVEVLQNASKFLTIDDGDEKYYEDPALKEDTKQYYDNQTRDLAATHGSFSSN